MKAIISNHGALTQPLPGIRLAADSAIGRQCEPFWLDTDRGLSYTALICPCYRVGRQGKNIGRKFASRYIDAITLAAILLPTEYAAAPLLAPELYYASNQALIPGNDSDGYQPGEHVMQGDGHSVTFSAADFIDEAIPAITPYMTIKTGDRLIDCSHAIAVAVSQRHYIEAILDGVTVLKFKAL